MATKQKTIRYAAPIKTTLTNNTLENFTQFTVYIPDFVSFDSVYVELTFDDITTASSTYTTKRVDLQLGSAGYETQSNTGSLTTGGVARNISTKLTRNYTSYFTTNWTGTSMTCDIAALVNQTAGTTVGQVNCTAEVIINYNYDDTSDKQVKTIALALPVTQGALPTSKISHYTIPALDTALVEAGKVYRGIYIVTEANTNTKTTTDHTVSYELSSIGATTTQAYENSGSTSRWAKYTYAPSFDTSTTHTWNVWASEADRMNNMQATMYITYEFDLSDTVAGGVMTTSAYYPLEMVTPIGTSTSDYQRSYRQILVPEENPTLVSMGAYINFETAISLGNLMNGRINEAVGWTTFAQDDLGFIAGQKGCMLFDDTYTLAEGINDISVDMYSTSAQTPSNMSGFVLVTYTCDIPSGGVGVATHTVFHTIKLMPGTSSTASTTVDTADAALVDLPDTDYYISGTGLINEYTQSSNFQGSGINISVERLVAEGEVTFENCYADMVTSDAIPGTHRNVALVRDLFQRWNGELDTSRMALDSVRTWKTFLGNTTQSLIFGYHYSLRSMVTYHGITFSVANNITNSNGGTVDITLYREQNGVKESIKEGTRNGNGAYSIKMGRGDQTVFTDGYEDGTYKGRSATGTPTRD